MVQCALTLWSRKHMVKCSDAFWGGASFDHQSQEARWLAWLVIKPSSEYKNSLSTICAVLQHHTVCAAVSQWMAGRHKNWKIHPKIFQLNFSNFLYSSLFCSGLIFWIFFILCFLCLVRKKIMDHQHSNYCFWSKTERKMSAWILSFGTVMLVSRKSVSFVPSSKTLAPSWRVIMGTYDWATFVAQSCFC